MDTHSNFEQHLSESGQTSIWSFITRELDQPLWPSENEADTSGKVLYGSIKQWLMSDKNRLCHKPSRRQTNDTLILARLVAQFLTL